MIIIGGQLKENNISKDKYRLFSNKMRFLNLFLVMTIVAGHLSFWANGEDGLTEVFRKSTMGTMGWFFFVSAFWYFTNYNCSLFIEKFVIRLKTLLIPYLIFNAFAIFVNYNKIVLSVYGWKENVVSILKCFVFLEMPGYDILPLDSPTWYIIRLLTYFFVSPIIYILLKNRFISVISLVSIFYFTLQGSYYYFNGFLFVYCLGAFVSMHCREEFIEFITRFTIRTNVIIGIGIFVILYTLLSAIIICLFNVCSPMMVMHTLVQFLTSTVSIMFANVPELDTKWSGRAFLIFGGHKIWVIPLNVIFNYVDGIIGFNHPGIRTVMLCIAVVICTVVSSEILEKKVPKFYSVLTGSR